MGATALYPEKHDFSEAFDTMVVLIEERESDIFWKLKRTIGWGNEAIIAKGHKVVERFANDIISKKEEGMMKPSFKDVGGQKLDLLSLLMKNNPNLSRKQLRDNVMNIIVTFCSFSWYPSNVTVMLLCCQHIDCGERHYTNADDVAYCGTLQKGE